MGIAVFTAVGILVGVVVADTVGVTVMACVAFIDISVAVGEGVKVA